MMEALKVFTKAQVAAMSRGEKVCAFIESYIRVPEGKLLSKPFRLLAFQRKFIMAVYDNPAGTSRAYLSMGRKNGKTSLIAALLLAHIVGPEAIPNSQIVSGALSRAQAALVFKLAEKMVLLNPDLSAIIKITPSEKRLLGLTKNVEYHAVSAEAGTAHGMSPVLAILDETGQVKGPTDAFVEAIETAQGAYEHPLLIVISTQAATDGDLFSIWLDDAELSEDPRIISHVYAAPNDCALDDHAAWAAANPAMGVFRSEQDIKDFCARALRQPASENSFRWLYLNQRVEAHAPFVSRTVWEACGEPVNLQAFATGAVFGGLDLSSASDLTAKVYITMVDGRWHVKPTFWLPDFGLAAKSQADRVPYDVWHRQGYLRTTPGKSVEYEFVAHSLFEDVQNMNVVKIAFDTWNWRHLKPWLLAAGFREEQLEGDDAIFVSMRQGFQTMSPALRTMEEDLLEQRLQHGNHPVMNMCAANAVVSRDAAGNRKLDKAKASGRIDGLQALTMARSAAGIYVPPRQPEYQLLFLGGGA
jgi:phage terminase large subunit-like protein